MNIVDISHYQTIKDWKVVAQTVDTVFIKATQGVNYQDPMFLTHAKNAKANGLKITYYHFASLNDHDEVKDATLEAQFFINNIKLAPKNDLPLVLDLEENPSNLSKDEVLAWVNTFFYVLAQAGYSYVLYSYTPFLNSNLPANHKLGSVPLWLAAYGASYHTPTGWIKPWLWQYNDKGTINGIAGNVDLNKYV